MLGRAGAGSHQDRLLSFQPCGIDFGLVINQESRNALLLGALDQPFGIRAVLAPDHQHQINFRRDLRDRRLTVGGRVADVVLGRITDVGKAFLDRAERRRC